MTPKFRLALLSGIAVLLADQISKAVVHSTMALHQSIEIMPHFARLTYLRNTGAAFGFLSGSRSTLRMFFFILISGVAIGCVVYLLKNIRPERKATVLSLSLILGGAIGNLIDRIRLGEVIDFIDLHWYDWHWPAFNVADSAITVGVILLLIQMLRNRSFDF